MKSAIKQFVDTHETSISCSVGTAPAKFLYVYLCIILRSEKGWLRKIFFSMFLALRLSPLLIAFDRKVVRFHLFSLFGCSRHTVLSRVISVGLFREILITVRIRTFHRVMPNVLLKINFQCHCGTVVSLIWMSFSSLMSETLERRFCCQEYGNQIFVTNETLQGDFSFVNMKM